MANFFNDIVGGVKNAEKSFLGPTYNYAKQIKAPGELGMSSDGNMGALSRDIAGLINYTEVLVSGKTRGQRPNHPLGNRFYLKTGGECKGPNGNIHTRYLYVNNRPTGSIPFISSMSGQNLPEFRGLVPGTIENIGHLNPLAIFGGFMQGSTPKCRKINLPSDDGKTGLYVADTDIANLDACLFGGKNPVSGETKGGCASDGFQTMNKIMSGKEDSFFPVKSLKNNPIANIYNLGFGTLMIYLLYHLMTKK